METNIQDHNFIKQYAYKEKTLNEINYFEKKLYKIFWIFFISNLIMFLLFTVGITIKLEKLTNLSFLVIMSLVTMWLIIFFFYKTKIKRLFKKIK